MLDKQQLIHEIEAALDSHDREKINAVFGRATLARILQELRRGDEQLPSPPAGNDMSWNKVFTIIGTILIPVVGLFAWGHSDVSRDIARVEASIGEVRTDLSGFKDQSYERFADIQKQIADTRTEVASIRTDIAKLDREPQRP